jgi:uncharacterized FAD-dependent dehydrogenase
MEKIKLQLDNLELSPQKHESTLKSVIEAKYLIKVLSLQIIRKSLDARKKNRIVYKYRVVIEINANNLKQLLKHNEITLYEEKEDAFTFKKCEKPNVLIIGAGPAGLFCALRLIEYGLKVTILERGKKVEERAKDIGLLRNSGTLNLESNVLYGEGGAGTWSDGKLTTRIHKPGIEWFFSQMVEYGAEERILYEAKPHVGTDKLSLIMKNIRKKIEGSGSRIIFSEKVDSLIVGDDLIKGVRTSSGREYLAEKIVLATGHSARDVYEMLYKQGVALEKKGFALGARIEHPAEFINKIQYGKFAEYLEPADYKLVYNDRKNNRAVYSFCMCPGGEVINSSSEQGFLCTNGMSNSMRSYPYSNAAIVVGVHPADLPEDPLSGIHFQRKIEKTAFAAGSENFIAPAQRASSFINNKLDVEDILSSYQPAVCAADLNSVFPDWISKFLKIGLNNFEQKMKGFIEHGVLIGAETRTSSPVRIVRDKVSFNSISIKNLYPIGEGAGYAGGIVSSAVDGIRIADILVN